MGSGSDENEGECDAAANLAAQGREDDDGDCFGSVGVVDGPQGVEERGRRLKVAFPFVVVARERERDRRLRQD